MLGNGETLESARSERVMWAGTACAAPDLSGKELIWTAEVGVGTGTVGTYESYGYSTSPAFGSLTPAEGRFRLGTSEYTVTHVYTHSQALVIALASDLPPATATAAGLALHVCGEDEGLALRHNPTGPVYYSSAAFSYSFEQGFPDWSGHTTRRVWLSRADTTAPMLVPPPDGLVVNGATLTLTYDEALDAAGVPAMWGEFLVGVRRAGAALPGFTVTDGKVSGDQVVLTLSEPVRHGDRVGLGYAVPSDYPIRDLAGNFAVWFVEVGSKIRVTNRTLPNELATGTVKVSGGKTVGEELTASVPDLADADGLPDHPSEFTWTWYRLDGATETEIAEATGMGETYKTYTLAPADAGKQVRARLRFRDGAGSQEQLSSAAHPPSGRVMWPDDGNRLHGARSLGSGADLDRRGRGGE